MEAMTALHWLVLLPLQVSLPDFKDLLHLAML